MIFLEIINLLIQAHDRETNHFIRNNFPGKQIIFSRETSYLIRIMMSALSGV